MAIAAGPTFSMALIGTGPPVTQAFLSNPSFASNNFGVWLPSQSGKVYDLEYKAALSDTNWTLLPLVPGSSGLLRLADPVATDNERFYRVQRW